MSENQISSLIIKECIAIHKQLGPGLLESVYENCLAYQLMQAGLEVEKQKPIPLIFKDQKLECGFRADMIVERKVIIEVKACETLHDIHKSQVLTYLRLTDLRLGILLNFHVQLMKQGIFRVVNNL